MLSTRREPPGWAIGLSGKKIAWRSTLGEPVVVLIAQPVLGLPSIALEIEFPSCEWSATAEVILIGDGLALPLAGAAATVTSLRMKLPLSARPGPFLGRLV